MSTRTVHIARMQAGLIELCRTLVPDATVVWAPSELPRAAAAETIIACRLLAGPDDDPMGGASATPVELPLAATLTITDAIEDESVALRASGRRWEYTIEAGDTVGDVRDGLLAEIAAAPGPLVDATFVASGAASIAIEAAALGDLYKIAVRQSAEIATLVVTETGRGLAQSVDVRSWIEIQAATTSRAPRSGASAALAQILGRRQLPTATGILERYGLAITGAPGRIVGLDALSGPAWQSRAAVTLYVSQVGLAVEPVGAITRARATLSARGVNPDPITISLDVDSES